MDSGLRTIVLAYEWEDDGRGGNLGRAASLLLWRIVAAAE
jgi:hypothetical protein